MTKIPEHVVERVLEAAKIEEVVSDFVELKKKGVRYLGLCPFHGDRHIGSFVVYPKKHNFTCFSCGARGGVVEFLKKKEGLSFPDAIRWLGKKYNIEVDDVDVNYTPTPARPAPPPLPTLVLPREVVRKRVGHLENDNLINYIKNHIHWKNEQRARIHDVLREYCVGHVAIRNEHQFTVWWQIDAEGHPRTAHYMKYKPNGKRVKPNEEEYHTDWFHALLDRNKVRNLYDPDKQEMRQCLFGEHLLNRYPDAEVHIVESEKTAILMAIAYGNYRMQVWMACCGLTNLSRERLKPLIEQGRKIILYPDHDGIDRWQQQADYINYNNLYVNTEPVTKWWKPEDGEKADIADVVLRMIGCDEVKVPRPLSDIVYDHPAVATLIDNLNLIQTNE